jgi:dihydrofolate reductase
VIGGELTDSVRHERRDVIVAGSLSVVHALMAADLVDEHRLLTFPTTIGVGERLFQAGSSPAYLDCLSAVQTGAAVLSRYVRTPR